MEIHWVAALALAAGIVALLLLAMAWAATLGCRSSVSVHMSDGSTIDVDGIAPVDAQLLAFRVVDSCSFRVAGDDDNVE